MQRRQPRVRRRVPAVRTATSTRAVDDYCALLGLPPGLIENVTDGTDALLVAIDADGRLLGSEEEIVDAKRQNRIKDIFLLAATGCRTPICQVLQRATQDALARAADGARGARGAQSAARRRDRAGRPDHLCAGHAALEPVSRRT